MSTYYGAICDEFLISSRLHLKLELPTERETLLHFFDRLRREFPQLTRMRKRKHGALALEEEEDSPTRMWVRLDPKCIRFGESNPSDVQRPRALAAAILEHAPYHLSLSDLDVDRLEVVYSFDLDYSGNHDELVYETLMADHPLAAFLGGDRVHHVIECQPCLGIALNPECDDQAYVEVRSRSTTYEASRGQYESRPLTVGLTVRRYWSTGKDVSLISAYDELRSSADALAGEHVVPLLVNPLAHAIASRP